MQLIGANRVFSHSLLSLLRPGALLIEAVETRRALIPWSERIAGKSAGESAGELIKNLSEELPVEGACRLYLKDRGIAPQRKNGHTKQKPVCPPGQLLFSDQRKEEKALWKDC